MIKFFSRLMHLLQPNSLIKHVSCTVLPLNQHQVVFYLSTFLIIKAPFSWSENRKDGKGRVENREENDVFPCLVQVRKHKGWKILGEKIHPCPQIFILPIWEEKWEEKRKKRDLALELHIYPIDVLYISFFSFYFILFYYGNLRACDLCVRSLTPCFFLPFSLFFFFFWVLELLILFLFYFFNEEIIHTYFF